MATSSGNKLSGQLQEYFDQLASNWDNEVTWERLNCLSNIVNELDIKPASYVLDVGSGTGVFLPFLIQAIDDKGKIIALDFSQKMLLRAKTKAFPAGVDYIRADVITIPLSNKSVDLAMCNSAFPHFSDKAKALREIARVLRDDGRLVICHTMGREAINQLHQSIGGIVGNDLLPDEFELRQLMKHAGFKITCIEDGPRRYLVIAKKIAQVPNLD
jgi:ubiquinone/menaquinone biosynthesis C-methylase UbiE